MARLLVMYGQINDRELRAAGRDRRWLTAQLARLGLTAKQTLVAGVDEEGRFFAQEKEGRA